MFFDPSLFPITSLLEANWRVIRRELEALSDTQFVPWKETNLYTTGWDVYGFYAFGSKIQDHCRQCPESAAVIEQIPGVVTAGFSSLKPMTHIKPHFGYTYTYSPTGLSERKDLNDGVLRCHLALIVPPALTSIGCCIRVGDYLSNWEEGKCLVFDDSMEHEAWNRTEGTRVVLIIDFPKPMGFSVEAASTHAIAAKER